MQALRRILSFLGPYRHWAILAPLAMAVEVAMDLMQPRLVQRIVDQGIIHHDMSVVVHSGAWMIGLAVIGMVGGAGCTMLSVLAAQGMGSDLRSTVFRKVQALSFGNLDRLDTGALITRLTNDISQVQDTVMMALRIMVRAPLMLLGSLAMGFVTSPRLSLLFLFLIPTILAVLAWTIRRTFPLFSEVQRRLDTVNTVLQENLAGVRVVKAFGRSAFEMERFGTANDRLMDQNTLALRISAVTMPAVMLIMNAGIVGVLWLGGVLVIRHGLQIGQIIAFINYLMQTLMSLMMVSMLVLLVSRANASAQRIEEVLLAEPDVPAPSAALAGFEPRGRVAFEDVSFRYNSDDSDPVLRHVSFTAEPGQTVALLGATGAGKSSLVNLIPRFFDVTEGRVLIDGVEVRQMD
jgi:ATP-binding cassette subfamily B protein